MTEECKEAESSSPHRRGLGGGIAGISNIQHGIMNFEVFKLIKFIILSLLLISSFLFAGIDSSKILLNKVVQKLDKVNDYTADIQIKIDVNFLKINDTEAKVYFKKPGQFKMEAKGFAMIPKASLNFSPLSLLQQDFISVYIKNDTLDLMAADVIKLLPVQEDANFILATLWIDEVHSVVLKTEATTRDKGTFNIHFKYGSKIEYGLPDSAIFFFDVSKSRMPHFSIGSKKPKKPMTGNVKIIYSDYKINEGLDDSIFEEESEEEGWED